MKPRFALDLSNDAIRLLERQAEGWAEIGCADLSDPRLDRRLATLRSLAESLAPEGFCSKLILPNSQILYMTLAAPGPDAQARRIQIRRALEGRTPYAVDDLIFDWSGSGPSVRVAVLANVTLEEAETFAEAYGFRPAAFVAVPQDGTFGGEPFFGLTSMAARHLPPGLRYDRDQDPVRAARAADPVPDDPDEIDGQMSGDVAPADPADPALLSVSHAAAPEVAVDDPAISPADFAGSDDIPDAPVADHPGMAHHPAPDDVSDADAQAAPANPGSARPASAIVVATEFAEAASVFAFQPSASGILEPAARAEDIRRDETVADSGLEIDTGPPAEPEAPFEAIEDPDDTGHAPFSAQASALGADAAHPEELATERRPGPDVQAEVQDESPVALPTQTFHSRRQPGRSGSEGEHIASIVHRLGGLHAQDDKRPQSPAPRLTMTAVRSVTRPSAGATAEARNQMRRLGTAIVEFRSRAGQAAASAGRAGAEGLNRLGEHLPGLRDLAASGNERTIFGAPRAKGDNWRRVGVAATVAAILVVATIGLWTLVISGAEDGLRSGQDGASQGTRPTDESAAPASAPNQDAALAVRPTDPAPNAIPPGIDVAAPVEPSGSVADNAAKLAAVAPDPLPEPADLSLLPGESLAGDKPLPSQPIPQPYGTTFTYDPDGLIAPTPEGVVTPGGFTLVAGRPVRVPPVRPAGIADALATVEPIADAALAGKSPKAKPPALLSAPPTGAETAAIATDGILAPTPAPPVDPRHGAKKPRPRPEGVAQAAVALRENAARLAEAAEAAARAEAEAFEAALRGATPQAVASSRRPTVRPAGIAALAAAATATAASEPPPVDGSAVEAALAEAQAELQTTTASEPPPEAVDEPEPEEGIATLPTTRTVSKKSTIANAIDLGDVNLIGVYGSSANRRALVRMPNGRYVKVQVGDRLDGGKVAAIGDSELSYVKRGQTIVLKMLRKG